MKKTRIYLLLAIFTVVGFAIGLTFDNIIMKANANEPGKETVSLTENDIKLTATGTACSADYEIVSIYGRKYIIFSSGGDIEVLEY